MSSMDSLLPSIRAAGESRVGVGDSPSGLNDGNLTPVPPRAGGALALTYGNKSVWLWSDEVAAEDTALLSSTSTVCMSTPNFQLLCWVVGETQIFYVEIGGDKKVYDLKKVIKTELHPDFQDVAARNLTLYKVAILNDDNVNKSLQSVDLTKLTMLSSSPTVSHTFQDHPPRGSVFVVVVQPPGECKWLHTPAALMKSSIIVPTSIC
jgi:Crinkler effector protein N-terminal domain